MDGVLLKLVLTPALIGTASLAGRRWGPAVSGWLVGFPFTSAPIVFFLALAHGLGFAAAAATGTLMGTVSQAGFCLAYGRLASRGWPGAVAGGSLAFAASTAILQRLTLPLAPLALVALAALVVAIRLMPGRTGGPSATMGPLPLWDLPARMVVATGFVLLLTALAPALGPRLTGLLAPFPLYGGVLAVFGHHLQGPAAAVGVLRGLLLGTFGFGGFFLVLAAGLERAGIALAFAAAVALALVLQAGALWALRRRA